MRPSLLLVLLCAKVGFAQSDARLTYLSKQLTTASDPRVRAQTAVILGASKSPAAVAPLCGALKDKESVVRVAVVGALQELRQPSAASCLKERRADPSPEVRAAIARALSSLESQGKGALYLAVRPISDKTGKLPAAMVELAEERFRAKLTAVGAVFAPAEESLQEAKKVLKDRRLKGFLLLTELLPNGSGGLQFKVLCMTYPDQALKAQVAPRGSGPTAKLIPALVSKAVDETAEECGWSE